MRHRPSTEARFWLLVDVRMGGCWEWKGRRDEDGYGRFHVEGQTDRAHRLAYQWSGGLVPPGMTLDHLCRTPWCVNPTHLEPVPHRVNVLRGTSPVALNAVKTHCPRGHEYTGANTYRDRRGRRSCRSCHGPSGAPRVCLGPEERARRNRKCVLAKAKARRATGLCWLCSSPAVPKRTCCQVHLDAARAAYWSKKAERKNFAAGDAQQRDAQARRRPS